MTAKVRFNWVKVKLACQRHFEANESYFLGDAIAKREYWLIFTDDLSRCGLISQDNRDNWSSPW
jgi:hypothetical protein